MTDKRMAPQRYLFTGIATVIPIWVTWLVFEFILKKLSEIGRPWLRGMARATEEYMPSLRGIELASWLESALAVILTLAFLYCLGWITSKVIGKRIIALFDRVVAQIPYVTTVYSALKKMLSAIQQEPDKVQRVVLIPFPTPEMKTVGFVTRVLKDENTGQELAAVYVPTTPNPTSGYLEIVPLNQVVSTNWTVEEAMTFIISGGAVAPEHIQYSNSP